MLGCGDRCAEISGAHDRLKADRGVAVRPVRCRSAMLMLGSAAFVGGLAGCGSSSQATAGDKIAAVGAENEYADVISQVGGRYVSVTAVQSNPNTDPHSFEASPRVAQAVGAARLVVQNGLGYDSYMNRIEAASPTAARKIIDVQALLGLPDSTSNPHLWYKPSTMPALAAAIVRDLSALAPAHAAYFAAGARRFDASLNPWYRTIRQFAASSPHTPVATTEPVGDYLLQAAGATNLTPFGFQADVMDGVDPAPQEITFEDNLFSRHLIKVFVYNQQVTDGLTESFLAAAQRYGIPVVGVYETMPTPGYHYQSWMQAEIRALRRAVAEKVSTRRLT